MEKFFLIIGCVVGALSVMIGAFGAHYLKDILQNFGRIDTFETAVKYQFYHAFALLLLGIIMQNTQNSFLTIAGYLFLAGTIIFSGSLYILSLTGIRWLGAITPIGGLALIGGWIIMALGIYKNDKFLL